MTTQHPTSSRIMARLAGYSTAKTTKGLLAWVKKNGLPSLPPEKWQPRQKWHSIGLSWQPAAIFAYAKLTSQYTRLSNWESARPTCDVSRHETKLDKPFRYSGQHSGRTGHTYRPLYFSCFSISKASGAMATWERIDQAGNRLRDEYKAPRGYKWAIDEYGPKLQSIKHSDDNYHIDGSDLEKGVGYIRGKVLELAAKRLENARRQKARAHEDKAFFALLPRLQIRLQDSVRAGNCIQGTLAYAERHGVSREEALRNPEAFLPGSKIDVENQRALNAARAAFARETLVCI